MRLQRTDSFFITTDEKQALLAEHKERMYKCAAAPHNRPIVERQNKEEFDSFEKRRREEIISCDKRIIERLDGKVCLSVYSNLLSSSSLMYI